MPDPIHSELVETVQLLRELQAKATPGPYRAHDHNDMARLGEDPEKWMGYAWVGRITKQSEPDGRFDAGWLDRDSRKDASKEYRERASVDAHFVAEALNALPALLDLIERLTTAPAGEDADAEVERILAMSDEQILAEADACDLDWARGVKLGIKIGKGITAPSPVARVPDKPSDGEMILNSVREHLSDQPESGFWRMCSGCSGTDNPRIDAFKSSIGMGCRECGGLGMLWDDTDYDAMAREMLAEDASPSDGSGEDSGRYLVWSNEHSAWWGPDHCGYTRIIHRAGRYDRAEAMKIAGTRDGGWHVRKGNPDEIAIPEADAIEQYADITASQASSSETSGDDVGGGR